ncbi:F-box domain protein [Aspergillus novofumigatus IBT 16806]|uniref:F-box domain-containing protein n=1 Tax=Aspergillus novofumigatus (strain IBT 16806) TaxID=1392255 RepID=A0A2I1CNV8_ASPN1|nr:uncharacterized protein P174DRAFT_44333 [Aspergillus novofumigatus IBT 16806]PKX99286.1 hypothetical protein P174DRAFT_44333 [Aspergillus novofumigatus IBT 16806]
MAESQRLVLSTPELLEYILLYLDIESLLTSAQRVCHSWTRLIQTSPRLQQALFFKPTPPEKCREKLRNPLLAEHFWNFFPYHLDPFSMREYTYRMLSWGEQSDRRQKRFRREASWRRMNWIFKRYYHPCDAAPTTHWVTDGVQMDLIGLRMNMLYDLVLDSILGSLHQHWICWEGHMPLRIPWTALTGEFMSGLACLELREEKFIPREDSDDE